MEFEHVRPEVGLGFERDLIALQASEARAQARLDTFLGDLKTIVRIGEAHLFGNGQVTRPLSEQLAGIEPLVTPVPLIPHGFTYRACFRNGEVDLVEVVANYDREMHIRLATLRDLVLAKAVSLGHADLLALPSLQDSQAEIDDTAEWLAAHVGAEVADIGDEEESVTPFAYARPASQRRGMRYAIIVIRALRIRIRRGLSS